MQIKKVFSGKWSHLQTPEYLMSPPCITPWKGENDSVALLTDGFDDYMETAVSAKSAAAGAVH